MLTRSRLLVCAAAIGLLASGCMQSAEARKQQAVDHYVQSQLLLAKGDMDAALLELAEAVKRNPSLSVAHSAAGDIHRRRGDYQMAKVCYESACLSNPYSFRPHYNLGVTYQLLAEAARTAQAVEQNLRSAVAIYLRAVTIEPDDFDTNLNLGACYFQLGKYDIAEQYCQQAIQIDPDNPQAHSNLGVIYDSQNRLYEAIRQYKMSLELDTHQPNLLLNLGSTYLRQNRPKSALNAFELAAKADPNCAAAYEQIGSCLCQMRQFEQALAAYETAVRLEPGNYLYHRGVGAACISWFLTDPSKAELRDRGLEAWHVSLELRADQDDLRKLIQKYTPQPSAPQL